MWPPTDSVPDMILTPFSVACTAVPLSVDDLVSFDPHRARGGCPVKPRKFEERGASLTLTSFIYICQVPNLLSTFNLRAYQ